MEAKNQKWILRPGQRPIKPWAERQPAPKPKTVRVKKATLAKRSKKRKAPKARKPVAPVTFPEPPRPAVSGDARRLVLMGLEDLIVSAGEMEGVPRRTTNPSRWKWEQAPGTRAYDAILRVMTPGRLHRLGDLIATAGLPKNDVKRYVGDVLQRLDLIERVDAQAFAEKHGSRTRKALKGYRNLWRLTERGIAATELIAEADRAVGQGGGSGEAVEGLLRLL